MTSERSDAMAAFAKLLVLIAIFLLASYANAFLSTNQVAGDQVQVNHFIRLKETNKPNELFHDLIINLNGQTTNQRLEWNAELSNVLSSRQVKYSLSQKDAELPSRITDSQNTQSRGLCHGKKSEPESLAE